MTIRPFEERDYDRQAAIAAAIDPELARGAEWYRHRNQSWDPSLHRLRLVAEHGNQVVGYGEVANMWWTYQPRKFILRLNVDPLYQHQGIGSQLDARLMDALASWSPVVLRAETREIRPHSIAFLAHRGFAEIRRRWESRLVLRKAHIERFASAYERLTQQGIDIVTFADEQCRRGERLFHDVFALEQRANRDEPDFDPAAATVPFAQFVANELGPAPYVLNDGTFLALAEQRLVGVSRLQRDPSMPHRLHVGFTGVDPAYRGRGIAIALKLRTVEFGRTYGFEEIHAQNDATNAAMLHINASFGFEREPPSLVFEKRFT